MRNIDIFDRSRSHKATILLLAWPIFIEQLLRSLVQAADAAMVGSLGAAATASVAINSPPNMLIDGVLFAMGTGLTSLVARAVGALDEEAAKRYTQQGLLLVTLVGIPLSILVFSLARIVPAWMGGESEILADAEAYNRIISFSILFRGITIVLTAIFRGYGDTRSPMRVNVLVNILNVIGNFFLIYPTRSVELFGSSFTIAGAGWGVAGAAVATSLSTILGGIIMLALVFRKENDAHIKLDRGFLLDKSYSGAIIKLSTPAMMERFVMSSAFIVVGRAIASLGTAAVAANNLAGNAEAISFMPAFGFGAAVTTLFGQSIGAGDEETGKKYVKETITIGSIVMVFMSLVMFIFSRGIMRIFTPDPVVMEMGSVLLKILALIQVPQLASACWSGALKGAGDSTTPFFISLASMWGVRLLGAVLSVHVFHLGLYAVCVSTCLDVIVRCILFHNRYTHSAWKKRSTAG